MHELVTEDHHVRGFGFTAGEIVDPSWDSSFNLWLSLRSAILSCIHVNPSYKPSPVLAIAP